DFAELFDKLPDFVVLFDKLLVAVLVFLKLYQEYPPLKHLLSCLYEYYCVLSFCVQCDDMVCFQHDDNDDNDDDEDDVVVVVPSY
ncbi:hypothetical protein, partial [Bartonella grahamii]|uniref:hypothetical protein n=1 Tax=Bartonella grahamii TaxID=33045 RepID=UPI001ABB9CF4